jgi:spore germination protein GerM
VDFSKEFLDNRENVDELKNIYCIVNTLTELKEINYVQILIDGKENVYYGNINLSEKYLKLNE